MLSDAELLEAWAAGDRSAGQALFERYFAPVARFFRNKVNEPADDLVQRTFLACVEGRHRLRDPDQFRSYLFGAAHNVLRRHYEHRLRDGARPDFSETAICDLGEGPTTIMARRQEHRLLLEALRHTPFDYQVVLELHYWEQMPVAEIAAALELPLGTAKTRLRRARELLSERLDRLATSPTLLDSTRTDLDAWAQGVRGELL